MKGINIAVSSSYNWEDFFNCPDLDNPGIYIWSILYNGSQLIFYIGMTKNLRNRTNQHLKSTDADYLTGIVNPSHGIKNGYLPKDNKVMYKTKFLGPNETTTLTLDTNKFSKGEDYVFWCSFLGHWGVMNGTITIK